MPRKARVVLPNHPHHIIQRGHNRQPVFACNNDCRAYLKNLREWKQVYGCQVYAYCLMTNHVHLVVDPGGDSRALGLLMKRVAGRYTRLVNTLERRTGSLWEGRFKSSPIQTDSYLLACTRYVELNPVRAGMVSHPGEYAWSSYRSKVGLREWDWLDRDPCYLALGDSAALRAERYRQWVDQGYSDQELQLIRQACQRGQLTGNDRFVDEVEAMLGHRVEQRGPGRPSQA